jgi:hypothetical protein
MSTFTIYRSTGPLFFIALQGPHTFVLERKRRNSRKLRATRFETATLAHGWEQNEKVQWRRIAT